MFFLRLAGTFEVATSYLSLSLGVSGAAAPSMIQSHPIPSHPILMTHTHTHQGTEKLPVHSFLG